MFKIGDIAMFFNTQPTVFGNLKYKVIKVHGFWIFKTYDLEGYDDDNHKITQLRVRASQIVLIY